MKNSGDRQDLHPHEKELLECDTNIRRLGNCDFGCPANYSNIQVENERFFVPEDERVLSIIDKSSVGHLLREKMDLPSFEKAGPRQKLHFEPGMTRSAVVTCGGLCPGLNSVIRGIVMMNFYRFGNRVNFGIQYGYEGFIKEHNHEVLELTPDLVESIHQQGGTMLGSSIPRKVV